MTWALHLGDCIEGMKALADKSVDITLSDPPYSRGLYLNFRTNKGVRGREGKQSDAHLQLADQKIGAIDDILDEVAAEMVRLTRRWIVVFHDAEIADRWRKAFGPAYVLNAVNSQDKDRAGGHPCPKPEPLMERLISDFTMPGELVMDAFAGSGTTGVAAIRLGRRFVGFERDAKYHAIATKRLTATREQMGLFKEGA